MDDILPVIRGNLRLLVDSAPLRSYCLAVHFSFTKETKAAAQACLALPIAVIHSSNAPELKLIDASALLDLLRYHKRCSEQVLALRTNLPWRRADWVWFLCTDSGKNCPPAPKGVTMADGKCCIATMWWYEYMYTMFERLQYTPCSTSISEETHAFDKAIKAALKCHLCEKLAQQQMRAFVKELGRVVDNKVSKVKLGA